MEQTKEETKTVTTPEQGKLLLDYGIPESTADFIYEPWPGGEKHLVEKKGPCGFGEIPAWSLAKLAFTVMPGSIKPKIVGEEYLFKICRYDSSVGESGTISYDKNYAPMAGSYFGQSYPTKTNKDIIDCAVNLVIDLVKGGYLEEKYPTAIPDKNDLVKAAEDLFGGSLGGKSLIEAVREIGSKYNKEHKE